MFLRYAGIEQFGVLCPHVWCLRVLRGVLQRGCGLLSHVEGSFTPTVTFLFSVPPLLIHRLK